MVRTLLKPLSFLPMLMMLYMIFSFSAAPGEESASTSLQVSRMIVKVADTVLDLELDAAGTEHYADRIHGFVRKVAHVTEYFLLAISVAFPLYVYGVHGIWLMLLAGMICIGVACADEYHQLFVEGRGSSARDVLIDSCGVFAGIILVRMVGWTGRMTIFARREKKKKQNQ